MPIITLVVDNLRDKENFRYAINQFNLHCQFVQIWHGCSAGLVRLIKTYACKSAVAISIKQKLVLFHAVLI